MRPREALLARIATDALPVLALKVLNLERCEIEVAGARRLA